MPRRPTGMPIGRPRSRMLQEGPWTIVRKRRLEKGYSLEELSRMTGVPISTLNAIELGASSNPKYQTIRRLLSALDLRLEDVGAA